MVGLYVVVLTQRTVLAAAAYMQSLGVTNCLPEQGVGGTFWTARLYRGALHWQDDVIYVLHNPDDFTSYAAHGLEGLHGINPSAHYIRCVIRDGVGFTVSSIRRRLFVTPPPGMSEQTWMAAREKVPQPRRYLSLARYIAFVSRTGKRIVVIDRSAPLEVCNFMYAYRNDLEGIPTTADSPPSTATVMISDHLRRTLADKPPVEHQDCQCFLTVVLYKGEQADLREFVIPYVKESDITYRL